MIGSYTGRMAPPGSPKITSTPSSSSERMRARPPSMRSPGCGAGVAMSAPWVSGTDSVLSTGWRRSRAVAQNESDPPAGRSVAHAELLVDVRYVSTTYEFECAAHVTRSLPPVSDGARQSNLDDDRPVARRAARRGVRPHGRRQRAAPVPLRLPHRDLPRARHPASTPPPRSSGIRELGGLATPGHRGGRRSGPRAPGDRRAAPRWPASRPRAAPFSRRHLDLRRAPGHRRHRQVRVRHRPGRLDRPPGAASPAAVGSSA